MNRRATVTRPVDQGSKLCVRERLQREFPVWKLPKAETHFKVKTLEVNKSEAQSWSQLDRLGNNTLEVWSQQRWLYCIKFMYKNHRLHLCQRFFAELDLCQLNIEIQRICLDIARNPPMLFDRTPRLIIIFWFGSLSGLCLLRPLVYWKNQTSRQLRFASLERALDGGLMVLLFNERGRVQLILWVSYTVWHTPGLPDTRWFALDGWQSKSLNYRVCTLGLNWCAKHTVHTSGFLSWNSYDIHMADSWPMNHHRHHIGKKGWAETLPEAEDHLAIKANRA